MMQAPSNLRDAVTLHSRRGHFIYESGHHGDLWLDLDAVMSDDEGVARWAIELTARAMAFSPEVVCGPQTGGARLAEVIAGRLGVSCIHTERTEQNSGPPVRYSLPPDMRHRVAGRRVLLVDDAINAGSAVGASLAELNACGGQVVAIGCLLTLNQQAQQLADRFGLPLMTLLQLDQSLWTPTACPICCRA